MDFSFTDSFFGAPHHAALPFDNKMRAERGAIIIEGVIRSKLAGYLLQPVFTPTHESGEDFTSLALHHGASGTGITVKNIIIRS
jgi:hypothetical protein